MTKFSMQWMLRRKITKRGEMQMRKNKDKSLEIILTCKTYKKDAYEWINKWKIGGLLQIKNIKAEKGGLYKIKHREFSMARAKYGSVSAPSYIIQLEYISGDDTYIFGKFYEFTSLLHTKVPPEPVYKLYQWKVNITSPEVIIYPPREFSYLKINKDIMAIMSIQHKGAATLKMQGETLVVQTDKMGFYMIELWAKSKNKSKTQKLRFSRHNITKKFKKVRDKNLGK
jgi:TusA-related sulfurtransferase